MFLWILLIVGVAVYFIFNSNKEKTTASSGGQSALDLLKERFIKGEIDEEEYNRKKNIIEK